MGARVCVRACVHACARQLGPAKSGREIENCAKIAVKRYRAQKMQARSMRLSRVRREIFSSRWEIPMVGSRSARFRLCAERVKMQLFPRASERN